MIDKILSATLLASGGWIAALAFVASRGCRNRNQITPLRIATSDGEKLYAWLVTPLKLYLAHEAAITSKCSTFSSNLKNDYSFNLLSQDPGSRLVIYFHGNAGTIGQTRRTEAYRSITAGASNSIHVLAFDYRGFGKSTGSPTEAGLITDAISVINWAIHDANVSPERIVLVAQSLGTGLASAAAAHFITQTPKIEFGGIVLCAPFTSAADVFQNYRVLGSLPLLAPIGLVPGLQGWFSRRIKDSWDTSSRLRAVLDETESLRLTLVHATSDEVIPYVLTERLFDRLVSGPRAQDDLNEDSNSMVNEIDLGEAGSSKEWTSGSKIVRRVLLQYGGHNNIMKWAPVASEVTRSFMEKTQM